MELHRIYTALRLRVQRPIVRLRSRILGWARPRASARMHATLDAQPVFVLGCHRSGTSLLRRCLDSHSRLACPAETLFLEHFAAVLDMPDAALGFQALGIDPEEVRAELAARAESWFRGWAATQGKPRWVDKSPGVLAHLDGLEALFEGRARYVAIVRDGMDVATSIGGARPVWWQLEPLLRFEHDPYVAAAHYWDIRNIALLDFLDRHPDRSIRIRYEDLIRAPESTLARVLASIGEDWEPEVLDFNRGAHSSGLEDHHVSTTTTFQDNTGKHRALPLDTQRRMWTVVRETMLASGYEDRRY